VTPSIPVVTNDLPPGAKQWSWSPMSSTLIAETTRAAREPFDKMLEIYPDRVNPGALWSSARSVKP
jgi:hypothetical protein